MHPGDWGMWKEQPGCACGVRPWLAACPRFRLRCRRSRDDRFSRMRYARSMRLPSASASSAGAERHIPANAAHATARAARIRGGVFLRQVEADVALFHEAQGASKRTPRATKIGSGLPWPSGSSLRSHPASTGGDLIAEEARRGYAGRVRARAAARRSAAHSARRRLNSGSDVGGQGKSDGEGVAAEAREEIGAGFDGFEQLKSVDGSAGSMRDAIFHADDDAPAWRCVPPRARRGCR